MALFWFRINHKCIKILVGNKVDRDSERALTREEGMSLAQKHNVHFLNVVLKLERMCSNALKNSPQRYLPKTHTFCHLSF
ncbi:unnamed protein product, partial [Vitis vinifera]|uniref:Uncharacterized protein n=1 Tax=Vitis vinifera TaxID=29760 RepID=D7SYX7_VITVI